MPYKDPIKAREHARLRMANFRKRQPERSKAINKRSRIKHKATHDAYMEEYRLKNAEKLHQQDLAYKAAHRAERAAYAKAYVVANRLQVKALRKLRHEQNKEAENAASSARNKRNKDRIDAQRRQSYPERKAKVNAQRKIYRDSNPDLFRAIRQRRRAKKLGAHRNDFTTEQRTMVIAAAHGVCAYCPYYKPGCEECLAGTHELHTDHITAVTEGGPNTLWNIVAACGSCNSRKRTKPAPGLVQPWLL